MLKKLESLRKQNKSVRDRVALLVATLFTAVIVVIWGLSIPAQISNLPDFSAVENDESGGFSRAMEDIGSQFANVMGGFEGVVGDFGPPSSTSPPIEFSAEDLEQFDLEAFFGTGEDTPPQPTGGPTPTTHSTTTSPASASAPVAEPGPTATAPGQVILIATSSVEAD